MKAYLKIKNHWKNYSYLARFIVASMFVVSVCIIKISLNSQNAKIVNEPTDAVDLSALSTLTSNTVIPKSSSKKNNELNINLTTEKSVLSENSKTSPSNSAKQPLNVPSPSLDYTSLYPNLYANRPSMQVLPPKTAFLTFDDGPSERTAEILDILKQRNVKATFFVTGKTTEFAKSMMRRIVAEGHTIAIHTYTHNFKQIYSSVQAYLDDFNKIYTLIYDVTGVKAEIFRFPGGSKNGFNKNNYREFINEMTRRGFDYFDWNVSSGDAVSRTPTPANVCVSNVLNNCSNLNSCVVLMHDLRPKTTTVQALPDIIDGLESRGFKFDKLSHDIDPSSFSLVRPYR